jgi:hypothetical protein
MMARAGPLTPWLHIGVGATKSCRRILVIGSLLSEMPESKFTPEQAVELAAAFARFKVDYLFIGKSGAILLGYPAVTQDVDLFLPKNSENAVRVVEALTQLGFQLPETIQHKILRGADFVQLKNGPFDLDLVHAPDGIESYDAAKRRSVVHDGFPVANLRDIIASKRASGRQKDAMDLELLEEFRREYERRFAPRVESALQKALRRGVVKKRGHR